MEILMCKKYSLFINGSWIETGDWDKITNKYSGETFAEVALASAEHINQALTAAYSARKPMAELPAFKRASILEEIAAGLDERKEEIAEIICQEAGKAWKYSLGEAARAKETFTFAADVARTLHGETVPMDASTAGTGRLGFWMREPVGVVAAITPFNFPLNLVGHKVAPAIAAGCPIVLKPAGFTPVTAAILADIISKTELPSGAFNLVHGSGSVIGKQLVLDDRPQKITFTGSAEVGQWIIQNAGIKKVTLELGNNSSVVVDASANLDYAVERCVMGSYANSGQVCISVQRIYLHKDIYNEFTDKFIASSKEQVTGDPIDKNTDVGPMIAPQEVDRIEDWVNDAVEGGAKLLLGGKRINNHVFPPTVLTDVKPGMKLSCDEAFAPVVILQKVNSFEEGLKRSDETSYGLQAGVFTRDLDKAMKAIPALNFGGVIINDVPTFRVDHMPYGGNRKSGLGREGLRFAVEEMTNIKMVVLNSQTN